MGTLSGWTGRVAKCVQKLGPIFRRLAHADNAAAADIHSRVADRFERIEAILIAAGADDIGVIAGRGIEIMIVVSSPAALRSVACSGVNIPKVAQVSSPKP